MSCRPRSTAALFGSLDAAPPAPELANRILVLGRISHQKNVPLAVATLEALAAAGEHFQLTIAGRGEGSKDLIRLIACSPAAGRIRWIGAVPHDEVPALLREHGMLLLTSRYEASPTVVKEALRVMRPVVSTDVGDVADWLEADRTGFVCAATAEALADGVRAASRPDPRRPLSRHQSPGAAGRGPADERGAHALSPARQPVSAARVAWRPGAGGLRLAMLAAARGGTALLGLATFSSSPVL